MDLDFEICLESKYPVQGEIFLKCLPWLEIIFKASLTSSIILLPINNLLFCLDVSQGYVNGALNETRTH